MSPVLRIFVLLCTCIALALAIYDVYNNGVRVEIAMPLSIAFVVGACILLFAKNEE